MLTRTLSAALVGVDAFLVRVEVDLTSGLPRLRTIGLPDTAVRESGERIPAAIRNCGFPFPDGRITVSLSPADLRKAGSALDVAIAAGILGSQSFLRRRDVADVLLFGELALDGSLRPVRGVLAAAAAARRHAVVSLVVPVENAAEAAAVPGVQVFPARTLQGVVAILNGEPGVRPFDPGEFEAEESLASGGRIGTGRDGAPDLADVRGQLHARRALEIAAAGGHNLLFTGPPGAGKSMLARRLPGILPPLTAEESVEVTKVHSAAGLLAPGSSLVRERPFRAPHHSISGAGLVGGGSFVRPGEVSLAHHGVLFLDELPEFPRSVLDLLRQPLEDGEVLVARARHTARLPARFALVGAANPCPCGHRGDPSKCRCTPRMVEAYRRKLSGPLLDRIDLHVALPALPWADLAAREPGEPSAAVRTRVLRARATQTDRREATGAATNSFLPPEVLRRLAAPDTAGLRVLEAAVSRLGLSARGHDRILRVARTIADLEGAIAVRAAHVAEAVQYREV